MDTLVALVALQDFSVLYKELEAQKWPSQGGACGRTMKDDSLVVYVDVSENSGFSPKSSIKR